MAEAKHILAHKKKKKKEEPITPEILAKLVDKVAQESTESDELRIVTICLMGCAGFLRFNELAGLKESDLQVYSDHTEIFIKLINIEMEHRW